eukprot:jgi/Tetstr1/465834/TSEL_010454.t1
MSENVLVLEGAAGVVGFGVCDAWLREGAIVYAVDRDDDALRGLAEKLRDAGTIGTLVPITGDFSTEGNQLAKAAVESALGDGKVKHVISAIGCSRVATTGVTAPDALATMKETYEQVMYPNLLATTLFLDVVRNVAGGPFTTAGGPFTHHCPNPELFNVSMHGASLNHFGTILNGTTKNDPCRCNNLCCHYAIGFPGEAKSSFGDLLDKDFGPVSDSRAWGKAFVRVAKGPEKMGFIRMHDPAEVEVFVASKEWEWFADTGKFGPAP